VPNLWGQSDCTLIMLESNVFLVSVRSSLKKGSDEEKFVTRSTYGTRPSLSAAPYVYGVHLAGRALS